MDTTIQPHDPALLLDTLEQLLALDATNVEETLTRTCNFLARTFQSDKVDVLLYQSEDDALWVRGTSRTSMGQLQHDLGLNRLPLAGGGRAVEVFMTGRAYLHGQVDQDSGELEGIKVALGVKSAMAVPLVVANERRGVLMISSERSRQYGEASLRFLETTVPWVGEVTHRAEVVEQLQAEAIERTRRAAAEEVLTVMAHDFKNFLSPLALRLSLLRRRADQEGRTDEHEQLLETEGVLHYLRTLVDSLLDVARLDQGLFHLTLERADVTDLVRHIVEALRIGGVAIDIDAPRTVEADVDVVRVQIAVSNLISNAMVHARSTRPIRVSVKRIEVPDAPCVEVTVTDDGPGIAPEILPHLFERFAADRNSPGLGIGLYVARQVAEAHSGNLTVVSTPQVGTTFCLTLAAL